MCYNARRRPMTTALHDTVVRLAFVKQTIQLIADHNPSSSPTKQKKK
jgi:hypothetical protein